MRQKSLMGNLSDLQPGETLYLPAHPEILASAETLPRDRLSRHNEW